MTNPTSPGHPLFPIPRPRLILIRKGGERGQELPNGGEKRPCYFYFVKRDCKNGKECPFSRHAKLRDKTENNGPPRSRAHLRRAEERRRAAISKREIVREGTSARIHISRIGRPKVAASSTSSPSPKKSARFFYVTHTKQYVVEVREGTKWRSVEDPYQRHSNPRLREEKTFLSENVRGPTEAAKTAGDLLFEVPSGDASSRRRHGPAQG